MRIWAILAVALLPLGDARAEPSPPPRYQIGDVFEISRDLEMTEHGTDNSSSSSTDRDTVQVRVVSRSEAGLLLEYDLPKDTSADNRARQWQFPARVLAPADGPLQLQDVPALTARAADWLKRAGLPASTCGHYYFTWNVFQIECDPHSVVEIIEGFDLGPDDLAAGALFKDPLAVASGTVRAGTVSPGGAVFTVELAVDAAVVRRQSAQEDAVAAQMAGGSPVLNEVLRAHAVADASGTIEITFQTDALGRVTRQTKITKLTIKRANGVVETRTVTETLVRRLLSHE